MNDHNRKSILPPSASLPRWMRPIWGILRFVVWILVGYSASALFITRHAPVTLLSVALFALITWSAVVFTYVEMKR